MPLPSPYEALEGTIEMVVPEEAIRQCISAAAEFLIDRYGDSNPLYVVTLKGAMPMGTQLQQEMTRQAPTLHTEFETIIVETYDDDRVAGESRVVNDVDRRSIVNGRDVVPIDELLDTGNTVNCLVNHFLGRGAKSVNPVFMAEKEIEPERRVYTGKPLFMGFPGLTGWLVGYGMDDDQTRRGAYRGLPFIGRKIT